MHLLCNCSQNTQLTNGRPAAPPWTVIQYSTKYYYAMGFGHTVRSFCVITPPMPGPDVPFKFGIIGNKRNHTEFISCLTTDP